MSPGKFFSTIVFFSWAISAQAQSLIDVSFPDGTGTNPEFLGIDNGVGIRLNP